MRYEKGRAKIEWVKDAEKRNEALDCRVYAFAALRLDSPDWQREGYRIKLRAAAENEKAAAADADDALPVVKEHLTTERKLPAVRPAFPPKPAPAEPPAPPAKEKPVSVLARLTALRRRR